METFIEEKEENIFCYREEDEKGNIIYCFQLNLLSRPSLRAEQISTEEEIRENVLNYVSKIIKRQPKLANPDYGRILDYEVSNNEIPESDIIDIVSPQL